MIASLASSFFPNTPLEVSSVLCLYFLHEDVDGPLGREARTEGLHHERLLPDGGRPVDQGHLAVLVDIQLAQGHVDQILQKSAEAG